MQTIHDKEYLEMIETFVRFTFKHTARETLYFDSDSLTAGVNIFYQKKVLTTASTYFLLSRYYRHPCTHRYYHTPFLQYSEHSSQYNFKQRKGYPYRFCFEEVFSITDLEYYGLANLTTILNELNIPY